MRIGAAVWTGLSLLALYLVSLHVVIFHRMRSTVLRSQLELVRLQTRMDAAVSDKQQVRSDEGVLSSKISSVISPYESCETRFGLSLVDAWRASKQEWCATDPEASTGLSSNIECYPYLQQHKAQAKRATDMFCVGTNVFVDFSKVSGEPVSDPLKPHSGQQYLSFSPGALLSPCRKTSHYKESAFMNHHALMMRSFTSDLTTLPNTYETVEHPVYMLARDEDCENTFHAMADFMNALLVHLILDAQLLQHQQVLLMDRFSDGPYIDLIRRALSPAHPVIRHSEHRGKTVLFRRLVFHLESPAALIFPEVAIPDPLTCYSTGLFHEFRRLVLTTYNLWHVQPPVIPSVILSLRYRTPHKNVGRVLANENEVIQVLKQGNMMRFEVMDNAVLSFEEQLRRIRSCNVLVGVHGAGLMLIMFAAEEAVLLEIHPSYRQDRHFRHAARMTGKIYLPMRSTSRETCQGTSDNVFVQIDEFTRTLDGAIRLSRSFDDGLAECGLVCDPRVLAIDKGLIPYYKTPSDRGNSLDLSFPC